MNTPLALAAAFGVALAAAAMALPPAPASAASGKAASSAPRACFFSRELSNWKEVDDDTVNLRVGVSDVYQLQLLNKCPDLRFAETIGVETRGGGDHVCSGLDISLIVPSTVTHSIPQRCMATSLRKLSKEEAKALPKGQRP